MMSVMTMTGRKLASDPFSGDITTWTSYNKYLDLHMLLMQKKKKNGTLDIWEATAGPGFLNVKIIMKTSFECKLPLGLTASKSISCSMETVAGCLLEESSCFPRLLDLSTPVVCSSVQWWDCGVHTETTEGLRLRDLARLCQIFEAG